MSYHALNAEDELLLASIVDIPEPIELEDVVKELGSKFICEFRVICGSSTLQNLNQLFQTQPK